MIPSLIDNALGFNIYRAGLLVRRELIRALTDYKLTPEQWQILITLWTIGKPLSQKEIVRDTLKDKHTVSRIIKRLERDGWITKVVSLKDKRLTLIHLTEKGISMKEKVPGKLFTHFGEVISDFPQEDRDQLLHLLKKFRMVLGDYNQEIE